MTPNQLPGFDRVSRRSVLKTVGLSTTVGGLAGRFQSDEAGYVLEQGGNCVPIQPLSGDLPVEEFYDYSIREVYASDENGGRDPGSRPYYSSVGTTHLQQAGTSLLFLYEGPNGTSLVAVHGRAGDRSSPGGSVSFDVAGLPSSGSWVVKDDLYRDPSSGELAATNYDRWSIDGADHRIDWTWGTAATDGGAFLGLGSGSTVSITPAFNEQAALWNQHYEGRVEEWQVLSGDARDPTRTSLDMSTAVTIRSGRCDGQSGGGDGSGGDGDSGGDDGSGDGSSDDRDDGNRGSDRGNNRSEGEGNSKGNESKGEGNSNGKGKKKGKSNGKGNSERAAEHREEHRERNEEHREMHREWQEEHRELHEEEGEDEDWSEEHAEAHREWNEEHRESHDEWNEEHREMHREWNDDEEDDDD